MSRILSLGAPFGKRRVAIIHLGLPLLTA